jgi:serine/threonine protein kinase
MSSSAKSVSNAGLKIGGYSEAHLLKRAQQIVEEKSGKTPIFNKEAEDRIPTFNFDELTIGKVLGRGGFCVVSEVVKVELKGGNAKKQHSQKIQDDNYFSEIVQDRDFIASQYIREGKDYRYAIKRLKPDVTSDPQLFINGIVDLAIEARFLSVIRHPKYVSVS